MIADLHERLIQDVLEGTATPAQVAEVERLRHTNPEFAARHDELATVFRVLDEPAPALPPGLHDEIMRAVAAEPRAAVVPARRRIPAFVTFLAGAAAASVVLMTLLQGGATGPAGSPGSSLSGTMAPAARAPGAVVARVALDATGGRIDVVATRNGSQVRVAIHARCSRTTTLTLDYPPAALDVQALGWANPARDVAIAGGRMTLAVANDDVEITFHAHTDVDAPIRLDAEGAGATLRTAAQPKGG